MVNSEKQHISWIYSVLRTVRPGLQTIVSELLTLWLWLTGETTWLLTGHFPTALAPGDSAVWKGSLALHITPLYYQIQVKARGMFASFCQHSPYLVLLKLANPTEYQHNAAFRTELFPALSVLRIMSWLCGVTLKSSSGRSQSVVMLQSLCRMCVHHFRVFSLL